METFLALCRPGFESDLAAEFTERAADLGVAGYPRADKNKGYVLWHSQQGSVMPLLDTGLGGGRRRVASGAQGWGAGAGAGILLGLGISPTLAVILLVAGERLGAEYGVGADILQAGSLYDLERLFAGVVILSLLGVAVSAAVAAVERRVLRWRV